MMTEDCAWTGQLLAHPEGHHSPVPEGLPRRRWSQGTSTLQKSFLLAASTSSSPVGTPACHLQDWRPGLVLVGEHTQGAAGHMHQGLGSW